jgi:hypothetical protein
LVAGATRFGTGKLANPCHARTFGGGGVDGVIQQTVLDGLDGAACRLGTTREALVLSLGSAGSLPPRRWDRHTIDVAVRSGMLAAVNDAEQRGELPSVVAPVLRGAIHSAPIDQLVRGASAISDLVRGAISLGNLIG